MCFYLLKRKGRLKPTTARDSLKKPSGCKNPSAVLAMAALVEVGPIVKKLRSCRKWERFHNFLGSFLAPNRSNTMRRITIMSGPIRFMILAIVIGIKNLGYVCFVRKLCCVQSIHTDPADLYSLGIMCGVV